MISVTVPAYNEAERLPGFLDGLISYCESDRHEYEILVVDDGSRDGTSELARSYKELFPRLKVIRNRRNMGKGYSVKRGLLNSSGSVRLFLDSDGSVGPEEIGKNLHYILEKGYDIFAGSRVMRGEGRVLKAKLHRKLIGGVFNLLVRNLLFKEVKDTQCGFKMFKSEAVKTLFTPKRLRGFGFDMEILYLASRMGYKIKEGPVSWHHKSGSKINLFMDSARIFLDILKIRRMHGKKSHGDSAVKAKNDAESSHQGILRFFP